MRVYRSFPPVVLEIPVREYLRSVLPGLADLTMHRVPELTPAAWAASRK